MTAKAPKRRVAHFNQRIKGSGGTVGDSYRGSVRAHNARYRWIDCNGHLTKDLQWVNAHGSPFNPAWMPRGMKFEDYTWAQLHSRHPFLRSARDAFEDNASLGLKTEWEVKDLHPLTSDDDLATAFERLATDALAAYGDDWQKHVQIKVLTNLRGGLPYAKKVCRHASAAGFRTMLLPRGRARLKRINEPYITFSRGGRV